MQTLQSQYDCERQKRGDLEVQLAKMKQLLSTGQEALQQEQKTVEMLRQQMLVTSTPSPNSAAKVSFQDMTTKCYSHYKNYNQLRHFTNF